MTETNKRATFIPATSSGVFCRVPIQKMPALRDDPAWGEAMDWGEETDASKVDEYLYQ